MYFKVNVPDRVFVARAKSISELVCWIVNETEDMDLADAKNPDFSFFSVEPLMEDLRVNGSHFTKAIRDEVQRIVDNGYFGIEDEDQDDWVIIVEADEIQEVADNGKFGVVVKLANGVVMKMDEYAAMKDREEDPEPFIFVEDDELMVETKGQVVPLAELERVVDINI